ncbi:MAG: class I SAM-dependent methyltransferase [Cytophagaceae bacterium]
MNSLVEASKIIPFSSEPDPVKYRYYYDNKTFPHPDGLTLFTTLLKFRPKRIIEVGSGFSSALMLDTNEAFLDRSVKFTFIEPNPDISLTRLLRKEDYKNADVRQSFVQDVDLSLYESLEENDILFIDNSHVSKTGSDVNFLMTEVVPILKKGVLVHIHDIFYPFEYPKEWLLDLRINWNEIYMVHNFLLFNDYFEMVFFGDYMRQKMKAQSSNAVPLFFKERPGSLWIRKVK